MVRKHDKSRISKLEGQYLKYGILKITGIGEIYLIYNKIYLQSS